ncbi:hypothetical protein [Pedobacter paludis]|nr:hypothetical protein [Pedobacter paludis]
MKRSNIVFYVGILTVIMFTSCSKKNNPDDIQPKGYEGISPKIQGLISAELLDKFSGLGLKINRGGTPPNIEGIFIDNPQTLQVPFNANDPYPVGKVDKDYKFKFYDQIDDDVKMSYKDAVSVDKGDGIGSLISGSGNLFTLYGKTSGTESGISYTAVIIVSGEITPQGIKDFQFAAILVDKTGDATNTILQPKGTGRIWKDGNALASATTIF